MNLHDLTLIGLTMYLCEGTKLRKDPRYKNTYFYAIEFTNSDPILVKIFSQFLREVLIIDELKLKCEIFIYNDLKKEEIEKFWSEVTNIPIKNFHKTIVLKPKNIKNKLDLRGTCKLRYNDKKTFLRLNELIIKNIGIGSSLVK